MDKKNEPLKMTYMRALESYKKQDYKSAETFCYKILSIDAYHLDSILMLASIAGGNKDYDQAKELLIKAIEIQPKNTTAIHNLGTCYKEMKKFDEAKKYYEKVLQIDPKHTNANYNLGIIYYELKNLNKAKIYLKKTTEIQKNYGIAFFSLGNVHADSKEYNDAMSCYQKAIEINPRIVGAHNNLGLIYRILNDHENAVKSYQRAIKLQPKHGGAYHNLALAYKELGKFDQSIESHQKAIEYEPENLAHYYYLSELKKEILNSNLKNKIEKSLSNKNLTRKDSAFGNYLLAKYERKEKNYQKELKFLIEGHQNFIDSMKKKFDLGIKYCFDDVLQIEDGAKVEKTNADSYDEMKPIFIVGVPRCGSTLVEKIIASGSKLIPMGEETGIIENFVNKRILEKESLNLGSCLEIRKQLRVLYQDRGLVLKKNDNIFTDKSLNNFFYLKLIKEIFPNAKIINCKRDKLSSIVSIFQNNLIELAWTHNLNNILKYFDNYFKIIDNYDQEMPGTIYHLEFEKLTKEPEKESKKLMKFCELPWDKKCLKFYKRKDLISKTASNVKIREAIYKDSLEKYLPYKKLLSEYGKKYSWFN